MSQCSVVFLSVCLSVCLTVCWSQSCPMQKRLNRSRCRYRSESTFASNQDGVHILRGRGNLGGDVEIFPKGKFRAMTFGIFSHAITIVPFGRSLTQNVSQRRQIDKETNRQVIWHDASRSQWQEYAHIFPSATESMGDRGSKKAYTGPRTGIYLPTKSGCDRTVVVGRRSRNDRQTDKHNGMTIRLTLCERDAIHSS